MERGRHPTCTRVRELNVVNVKSAILGASESVNYMEALINFPVSAMGISVQKEPQETAKRKRYGPRVDVIYVCKGANRLDTIIVHCLKRDKKGYVTSGSLDKLAELVKPSVPRRAEGRYLVILLESKRI